MTLFLEYLGYTLLLFLTIRYMVVSVNFFSVPILPLYSMATLEKSMPSRPTLSVLIPARNEEKNIVKTIESVLGSLNFENYVKEICVLDDHSTDGTALTVHTLAQSQPRLKLVRGSALPEGWLGKNWACHQLGMQATGEVLLYLDADVQLKPRAIGSLWTRLHTRKLDLLSIFPDQKMESWGEWLMVPLMHYLLLTLLPLRLIKSSKNPAFAAANGQVMCFRSDTYRIQTPHQRVKNNILEDVNIVKELKETGCTCETLLANDLIVCRMYNNGIEAFKGFSKNLFLGFGKSTVGMFAYFFLILLGWPVAFWFLPLYMQILAVIAIVSIRVMISIVSKQKVMLNLMLHPLQMFFFMLIALQSIRAHSLGKVYWKGRKVV